MTLTLQRIKERTEEVGECWIWQQGTQGPYPQMKVKGRACKLVRRMVVELDGRPAGHRQPVISTCNDPLCVNPAHLKLSSIKAVCQKAAKEGAWTGKVRSAKIAATKRAKTGKIDMTIAQEIRMSQESGPTLAQKYGIDKSLVNRIRANKAWRDFGNPFIGLMS